MKKCQLRKASLFERVIALVEGARQKVATAANLAQVYTNYEIGRQIVEEEQGGKRRAGYGEKIIEDLSAKLTARFGKGWSARSIRQIRQFYVEYSTDEIRRELIAKSETMNSAISDCRNGNQKDLARSSRQVEGLAARLSAEFGNGWSVKQLRHCLRSAETFTQEEKFRVAIEVARSRIEAAKEAK